MELIVIMQDIDNFFSTTLFYNNDSFYNRNIAPGGSFLRLISMIPKFWHSTYLIFNSKIRGAGYILKYLSLIYE